MPLVLPFINTVTFADGAWEARSRRRGGVDAGTSTTTRDKEIARNPHPPEGLGRDGPIFLLFLLADVPASTRRLASTWSPSRSQQTSSYLWNGVLNSPFLMLAGLRGWQPHERAVFCTHSCSAPWLPWWLLPRPAAQDPRSTSGLSTPRLLPTPPTVPAPRDPELPMQTVRSPRPC